MEIPEWLKTGPGSGHHSPAAPLETGQKGFFRSRRFIDATLSHVISFLEDTMFNENTSTRNGFFQMIEPRIKVITLLLFIVLLSLQKSIGGIAIFFLLAILMGIASKVPLRSSLKRLLPGAVITLFISIPVLLNLVVDGQPLFVLFRFEGPLKIGPVVIPGEISITGQGLKSAITLFLRVIASMSLVFLLTMTTPPNAFIKALSSLIPGSLKSVVSISYRYIFFLVRKVEQFVMGLKSRQIAVMNPAKGRHWVASRIGLLFSMSMELSNELAMAMESRGYREGSSGVQGSPFKVRDLSRKDIGWLVFSILFTGVMIWKSFA
jgi:cobalt/nickel transport system permease protein